jgi:phosphoribosylformimino-5-aminoimidazole carboxamide ribotide isomerase
MRLIPVLDLLDGQVVRGVAGQRSAYRPVQSLLADGADPIVIARALRETLGADELYVADLDAILGGTAHLDVLRRLADERLDVLADCGIRRAPQAEPLFAAGVSRVIAGSETLAGPQELAALGRRWPPSRVVFSLDLRGGVPVANGAWSGWSPAAMAECAVDAGLPEIIVLDVAQVGTKGGLATLALCAAIREAHPGLSIVTGGGVRDVADLLRLSEAGIDAVLIASALHDGSITRRDIERLSRATRRP